MIDDGISKPSFFIQGSLQRKVGDGISKPSFGIQGSLQRKVGRNAMK